jgi:large subunit ribosomal protein L15
MVIRQKSRSRRFLGTRRWGAGNIKNRRGSGSRGGVGRAGKKHKFTRIVKYERERLRKKGFSPYRKEHLAVINLDDVSKAAQGKNEVELAGYKVLGGGRLSGPINVKASGFSKNASEKIKQAGGQASQL